MPDSWRMGAYTASDNTVHGRGSGHARLIMLGFCELGYNWVRIAGNSPLRYHDIFWQLKT